MRYLFVALLMFSGAPAFAPPTRPLRVHVVNRSTVLSQAEVDTAVAAVREQIGRDFRQYYFAGRPIELNTSGQGWRVTITDDQLPHGDSGFHSYNADGTPYAKVTTLGTTLSSALSHEILEMLADPFPPGREIVDGLGIYYQIDGEQVCDFRLPKGSAEPDFCGTVNFCY